jgi:DnaK suppressor protein
MAKKTAKKATAKKTKPVAKKAAKKAGAAAQKVAQKTAKKAAKKAKKKAAKKEVEEVVQPEGIPSHIKGYQDDPKYADFIKAQRQNLLDLRDSMLDTMSGVAQDNLRNENGDNDASAFGMHQADAGSDAYDRDFALSLLSQEQDALYEIEEALKRMDRGVYGICEASYKMIPIPRLEAIPFARLTVECQSQFEEQMKGRYIDRGSVSAFGLVGDGEPGEEREESVEDS